MAVMTFDAKNVDVVGTDVRQNAFVRAQKHSRRVNVLKIALPLLAIVMGGGFIAYTYLISPNTVSINVAESAISDGRLVMASPKLEGFTKDNRPYQMTATRAFQDLTDMSQVELEDISATLPFDAENIATVRSAGGLYDQTKNTLDLKGALTIKTKDGMSAKLDSAFVDVAKGSIRSDKPVEIQANGMNVTADSLQVQDSGKIMIFDKRVRMVVDPAARKAAQPKADGS